MFDVLTDHQIVAFSTDQMALFDAATGDRIAVAIRTAGTWTITADGIANTTATTRADAITALTSQTLKKLGPSGPGGQGYSTTIPHGLADQP